MKGEQPFGGSPLQCHRVATRRLSAGAQRPEDRGSQVLCWGGREGDDPVRPLCRKDNARELVYFDFLFMCVCILDICLKKFFLLKYS